MSGLGFADKLDLEHGMSKNGASLEEKTQEWPSISRLFDAKLGYFCFYLEKTQVFWRLNASKLSRGVMLHVENSSCSGTKSRSRHARNPNADTA